MPIFLLVEEVDRKAYLNATAVERERRSWTLASVCTHLDTNDVRAGRRIGIVAQYFMTRLAQTNVLVSSAGVFQPSSGNFLVQF
jgi:hypothetical protein